MLGTGVGRMLMCMKIMWHDVSCDALCRSVTAARVEMDGPLVSVHVGLHYGSCVLH